ncbi:nitric oxide reductase transcription regulator, partial [Aeromonas media]
LHPPGGIATPQPAPQPPPHANHQLTLAHALLPPSPSPAIVPVAPLPGGPGLRAATDAFQLALIEQPLAAPQGNWAATARALELDGGNLHRLAKRLGLKP